MSRSRLPLSQTVSVAAPIGGWNARDALGAMDKMDAVTLTNWWPGTSSVILRYGYTQHATGIGAQVETLLVYNGGATSKMFAAAGTSIYDATSNGAVGTASVSGLTNARWQYTNITTGAGTYLTAINGADKAITYDGSAWHADGGGSPYNISGVDSATLIDVINFKERLWYVQVNTLKAWYLGLDAIGGTATALDMSSIPRKGGYIMAAGVWTLDAGYGMDDYLAFITSEGEVIIWQCTDPTLSTAIALIGVYEIGAPIGRRCFLKYGGDMLLITQDGVVPMSAALQSSRLDPRVSLTDKIQFAVSTAITSYGANFGWQLCYFPKQNQLYCNVPVMEGSQQQQYVMNTITKSWCNFTGWAANCLAIFNDNLYFGGNGIVGHAWNGLVDQTSDIQAFGLQSFQYYGSSAEKQCSMIRPHILTNGSPSIYGNVNTDFNLADTTASLVFSPIGYALWDTALWDTDVWGSDLVPEAEWQGATGIGYCLAPVLKVASQGIQVQWLSNDLVISTGGTL